MTKQYFLIFTTWLLAIYLIPTDLHGQTTTVSGVITDAETGDPIPFANVIFAGTNNGMTTDFEGKFSIASKEKVDSVHVSYIGYTPKIKAIEYGKSQTLNFQLDPETVNLQEVVFNAGENPAFEILRRVQDHKDINDKRNLEAYDYESYTKVEVDVDDINQKIKGSAPFRKIFEVIDSLKQISDDEGKIIVPVFISETLSRVYQKNNPETKRENITKTKVTGVGLDNNELLTQIVGNSLQDFNFYRNWIKLLYKDFVSPIASSGRIYYDYELSDSLMIDKDFCYRLDIYPKSEQDLAFSGTVWITKNEYALKRLDLTVGKEATLNYVDKIKIQQEYEKVENGAWLPSKTRIMMDIKAFQGLPGMIAKSYVSNRDFEINHPMPDKYYEVFVDVAEDARLESKDFWEDHRHEPLTKTDLQVRAMIDTINQIPLVKTYVELLDILINGYKTIGKVDVGPYISAYAFNNVEGHRFRLGFRTNPYFSKKWILKGYGAYGTKDGKFKYGGSIDYIFTRHPWTQFSIGHVHDIDQVGIQASEISDDNSIFYSFSRFGDLVRPYWLTQSYVSLKSALNKGFTESISLTRKSFDPLFNFAYRQDPTDENSQLREEYSTTELAITTRFARDEKYVEYWNERVNVGLNIWPVFTVRYTLGLENLFGGDFTYHRLDASIKQDLRLGFFGTSTYYLKGGYIFNQLPYPLLKVHLGNESPFYTNVAFNTMNYFEFVSDTYASLQYQHSFEGFILNRVPLIKKLKWRLVANANVLYGSTRQENKDIIAESNSQGDPIPGFGYLDKGIPFVELGYGIENIFKIGRIDAFHRLTYLDNPNVSKFTVKISIQVIL